MYDSGLKQDECYRRNTTTHWFQGTVSPLVFTIKTALRSTISISSKGNSKQACLIQSISIKCCSATLFSLFTFLCSAVKMFFFSIKYSPDLLLISNISSFAVPFVSVAAPASLGGIEKYSNSSLSTIIACFDKRGLEPG